MTVFNFFTTKTVSAPNVIAPAYALQQLGRAASLCVQAGAPIDSEIGGWRIKLAPIEIFRAARQMLPEDIGVVPPMAPTSTA